MRLDRLGEGESAVVVGIDGDRALRRRLLELGFVRGGTVAVSRFSAGIIEVVVRGSRLAVRLSDAARINVERGVCDGCGNRSCGKPKLR